MISNTKKEDLKDLIEKENLGLNRNLNIYIWSAISFILNRGIFIWKCRTLSADQDLRPGSMPSMEIMVINLFIFHYFTFL